MLNETERNYDIERPALGEVVMFEGVEGMKYPYFHSPSSLYSLPGVPQAPSPTRYGRVASKYHLLLG